MKRQGLIWKFALILVLCFPLVAYAQNTWPVPDSTRITQYFGGSNLGIDIGGSVQGVAGDDIVTFRNGNVRLAGVVGDYGNVVYINHVVDGVYYQSRYAHLDSISVTNGQYVTAGTKIGEMGDTGNVTGVHLHFETRECVSSGCTNVNSSSTPVDPLANFFPDMSFTFDNSNTEETSNYKEIDLEDYFEVEEILEKEEQSRAISEMLGNPTY